MKQLAAALVFVAACGLIYTLMQSGTIVLFVFLGACMIASWAGGVIYAILRSTK